MKGDDLTPVSDRAQQGVEEDAQHQGDRGGILGAPAKGGDRGRRALVTSGVHMWNGTAEILKARPAMTNMPMTTQPSGRPPLERRLDRRGGGGAGIAVDQAGAVEQKAGRQRAQHE